MAWSTSGLGLGPIKLFRKYHRHVQTEIITESEGFKKKNQSSHMHKSNLDFKPVCSYLEKQKKMLLYISLLRFVSVIDVDPISF